MEVSAESGRRRWWPAALAALGGTAVVALVLSLLGGGPFRAVEEPAPDGTLHLAAAEDGSAMRALDVSLSGRLQRGRSDRRQTQPMETSPYSMVGFTWREETEPTIRIRTRTGGSWRAWREMPHLHADEARTARRGTDGVWVGLSDGIQVQVLGDGPESLQMALIQPGAQAGDEETRAVLALPSGRAAPAKRPKRAPRPAIGSRASWGADPRLRDGTSAAAGPTRMVHVHHTASANGYSRADVPRMIRSMYRYHTVNLGWSDLGYNFLVDRFGRAWVGRAGSAGGNVRGAHTLGFNHRSVGIAVIGNYEKVRPSRRALNMVAALAAWRLDRTGIRPAGTVRVTSGGSDRQPAGTKVRLPAIDGHRDTNLTACPGKYLYQRLGYLRKRAQARADRF